MLDANLDRLTWICADSLPSSHSSVKLKKSIDLLFNKIIPIGVIQMVTTATRFQQGHPMSGLDHIYPALSGYIITVMGDSPYG